MGRAWLLPLWMSACAMSGYERPDVPVSQIDALVHDLPPAATVSIQSLGEYVKNERSSPRARIKALHDWVADNIEYDVDALELARIPDEDADPEWVFAHRKGVCSGYAALLEALGDVAGLDIRVVVGTVRSSDNRFDGGPHAWNAILLDGDEWAIDATWDAGFVDGRLFHRRYSTKYFLRPLWERGSNHDPSVRDRVEHDITLIVPELDRIWASDAPPAERRATLFAFWDDTAGPDDPERAQEGELARLVIKAWVRKYLPESSDVAFTAEELARLNAGHQRRFDPYR